MQEGLEESKLDQHVPPELSHQEKFLPPSTLNSIKKPIQNNFSNGIISLRLNWSYAVLETLTTLHYSSALIVKETIVFLTGTIKSVPIRSRPNHILQTRKV